MPSYARDLLRETGGDCLQDFVSRRVAPHFDARQSDSQVTGTLIRKFGAKPITTRLRVRS